MIDTFSVNSLKLIQKSTEEFKNKYIEGLEFYKKDESASLGNIFHTLISYYLRGYDIEKYLENLDSAKKETLYFVLNSGIMKTILASDKKFIEQPFFVKFEFKNAPYYLTGRFDLVIQKGDKFTIIDWKTKTIPKNPMDDIQTVVYTYALSKMTGTKEIEMVYYSLSTGETAQVGFGNNQAEKIGEIISRVL